MNKKFITHITYLKFTSSLNCIF